jgi:hypothetical protein
MVPRVSKLECFGVWCFLLASIICSTPLSCEPIGGEEPPATPALGHPAAAGSPSYLGAWQDLAEQDYRILLEETRLTTSVNGKVRGVAKILGSAGPRLQLCDYGRDREIELALNGPDLVLRELKTGETRHLRRLARTPADLDLAPLALPKAVSLSLERVEPIQGELSRRFQEDQAALMFTHGPPVPKDQPFLRPKYDPTASWGEERDLRQLEVLSSNTKYLKGLVSIVGWIDVRRFGYPASTAAFFIVQHSDDLPLMLAVLPGIKEDVDAGRTDGDAYALLFDRLQLNLGEKQRYGSQVMRDEFGDASLLPVEDPGRLDDLRKGLGMVPIAQYLAVFGATSVRISHACSPP